jgi:uroporphyrinogen-III synthase
MRLLVTRPEPDNERTASELRARGHQVLLAPMLRVEMVRDSELGSGPFAGVLFTSSNGARAIANHNRRAELIVLPALAVGASSAQAARDAGFADVTSADGDGGDLARLAASRFAGAAAPLLYPAGEERARELGGLLAASGIAVVTAVVYRTVKADAFPAIVSKAMAERSLDGVLHFSQRSVEAYLDCAASQHEAALAPIHYCLSARAAEPLRRAGASRILLADRPEEARLLALVTPAP